VRAALAAAAAVIAACGGAQAWSAPSAAPRWSLWVCHPDAKPDWCNVDLTTTLLNGDGTRTVRVPRASKPVDCFYVYPTVSLQRRPNARLRLEASVRNTVMTQASYFSQVCRVFAPVYRQVTVYSSSGTVPRGSRDVAYADVLAAWRAYLARDNKGRGVVLIGHSQGAGVLSRLIQEAIEPSASARRLLVSAILLGGGVTVAQGSDRGGDFKRIPACRSRTQLACVVAFSAWSRTPPADAGMTDARDPSEEVLCVNPAALEGGEAAVTPVVPFFNGEGLITKKLSPPTSTFWISLPGLYTAHCVRQGGRAWLRVDPTRRPGDRRELAKEILSPQMGLHAADVNIAIVELIDLVRAQGAAYAARR
jgi:pimeloyl-ACP methyl ester carboxylesterase